MPAKRANVVQEVIKAVDEGRLRLSFHAQGQMAKRDILVSDLEEALKYSDKSIQNEERYDNLITKSRVLQALGRKDDATATQNKALAMANAAVADGKPGKAAQIFIRDIVGMPAFSARMLRLLVPVLPRLRVLIPRQIRDLDGVGLRLDAYAKITTPAVLLGGERSPAHLAQSLDALATVMPHAERVTLPRRDHFANRKAPAEVARVIEALARQVLH